MDNNPSLDSALQRQLVEIFRAEAGERIAALRGHLKELAAQPTQPDEVLKSARREAHNLKGSAATVGAERVSELSQRLEKQCVTLIGQGIAPSPTALAALNLFVNEVEKAVNAMV